MINIKDSNRKEHWSLLVKPTEACNLDCQYCYAKPFRDRYGDVKMDFETVDKLLRLASDRAQEIQWIWHGGEPTLMGVEWYKRVQELFYKYSHNTIFRQSMQSNGTLLNKDWAKLSNNYDINIGISFDVFNQDIRTGSNKNLVENNIQDFLDAGGRCGTITVINKENYKRQIELYEYFKKNSTFTPAFNHVYRTDGTLSFGLEIGIDDYNEEFLKYYNYWLNDTAPNAISERSLDMITKHITGNRYLVCTFSDCRDSWIGVNAVGALFPCDRYVPDKYSMGNLKDYESIEAMYNSDGYQLYYLETQQRFLTHCKECGYLQYCNGGCNANHIATTGDASKIDTFSCGLFKKKFNSIYKILRELDIYNKKYNFNLYRTLIEEPFFTIREIKELLSKYNLLIPEESLEDKEIFNSKEFKIMRIFNPFKGAIGPNGHTDYQVRRLSVNAKINHEFDMNSIKEERFKVLEDIFKENSNKILTILKGENNE